MADIVVIFRGEEYRIPETSAFRVAEQIENWYVQTFDGRSALFDLMKQGHAPNYTVIARVAAIMLNCAGKRVTSDEVWSEMLGRVKGGEPQVHMGSITALLAVLMDGAPQPQAGEEPEKKGDS